MPPAQFEKIASSNKRLYGESKILLCGFSAAAQPKLATVLTAGGLTEVPTVWASGSHTEQLLGQLMQLPDRSGWGMDSDLPRAIIVAGIMEKELLNFMALCRQAGMRQALWATLTPASEQWTLKRLLTELIEERAALSTKS